ALGQVTPSRAVAGRPAPRYTPGMSDDAFAQTLPTVAAGRAATVAQLRELATRLEQLPLDAVAEVPGAPRADAGRPAATGGARARTRAPLTVLASLTTT